MKVTQENSIHYKWGDDCDGWKFLDSDKLSIIKEKMPPQTFETPHYHKTATQFFYILRGIATFEIEAEVFTVNAGEAVEIKPCKKHRISNQTKEDLEFIVISQPTTKNGDRFE
jgi:mannose-6-phosphate isomerase-like protein (cupin superfamily)